MKRTADEKAEHSKVLWDLSNLYCGEVESFEDLCQAFHLVYKEYKAFGYTNANEDKSKLRFSLYQLFPVSHTFIAKAGNKYCGTATIVNDSELGLPADSVFHRQLNALRREGRKFVETTMLSCNASLGRRAGDISIEITNQCLSWWTKHCSIDDSLIIVNPRHVDFWNLKVGYEILGEVKSYGSVQGAPGFLMRLNLKDIREGRLEPMPLVRHSFVRPFTDKNTSKFHIKSHHVVKLLFNNPQLILEANPKQRAILKHSFPDLFMLLDQDFKASTKLFQETEQKEVSGYLAPTPQWLREHPAESRMLEIGFDA